MVLTSEDMILTSTKNKYRETNVVKVVDIVLEDCINEAL
jgi:hypothetical protein